jgi:predicted Zn-ribbon and HTH transcriptional regulator
MPEDHHDHICPKCFSDDIERVPREDTVDHVRGLFGWRVYRCRDCGARFHDRPVERTAS